MLCVFQTLVSTYQRSLALGTAPLILLAALLVVGGEHRRTLHAAGDYSITSDYIIYDDALENGYQDWGWADHDYANTTPVHAGTNSIRVTYGNNWEGLWMVNPGAGVNTSGYTALRFAIHGGTAGGQSIEVKAGAGQDYPTNVVQLSTYLSGGPVANAWRVVTIPLSALNLQDATLGNVAFQSAVESSQPTFYLDDIRLVAGTNPTATPIGGPTLTIDTQASGYPINPDIYGMNFTDEALAQELHLPVRRWGGNATTRYNWQLDTSNHASDWYFENIPNDNSNPGALPNGSSSDQFVEQDRRTGTSTIMTLPLIGWTPKARAYACGFSVSKYGSQQSTDPWRPDCGNGIRSNGSEITGNDPTDTSLAIDPAFAQSWIAHFIARYGNAAAGGVRYYNLDNEPMLWNETHRDVHPNPTSYDEMRDRTIAYAAAIKAADPTAQTLGPAEWGWTGYFYSALDWAPGGAWWNNPQDRNAHGGQPFVEWYLDQLKAYEQQHGIRLLDYLDLHYYPQANGVSLSPAGNATTQTLRLRSTRSLWDTSYTDESWIAEPVYLLPRMRAWRDTHYPGTKLAVTEYNWGALDHINGALAQADVLGIFGRERLDLATLWSPPNTNDPGAFAFRMYLNYDGAGHTFGNTSVPASSTDQDKLAVYAARRSSDNALTIIVVNKSSGTLTSNVNLTGANVTTSQVHRYSPANLTAIQHLSDQAVQTDHFSYTFPTNSITLFILLGYGGGLTATPTRTATTTTVTVTRTRTATRTATTTATTTLTGTLRPTRTATPTVIPSNTLTPTATPTRSCTGKPPRPRLLTPADGAMVSGTTLALDWRETRCATSYKVVVRQGSNSGKVVERGSGLGKSEYVTDALTVNRTYYWRVSACRDQACSHSGWWSVELRAP